MELILFKFVKRVFERRYANRCRAEWRSVMPGTRRPSRALDTDAGYDIYSAERLTIEPGRTEKVKTGIELSVPDGWYWTIEGRSSLNFRRIFVVRPIIDATYCGQAFVLMHNGSQEPYVVEVGDRIAQLLLHRRYDMQFEEVAEFSTPYSSRGHNGFGSTGK